MKIKSVECPKSIRYYEKNMLETSDAWSTSCLSHRPSDPAYYCTLSDLWAARVIWAEKKGLVKTWNL